MSKKERLQLENELLMTCSKAQAINKYIDELEESSKLSELWCKSQEENQELKLELSGYRQAILNDKEMLGLKEENQSLKEQKEEWINLLSMFKNQQKEFVEYLEDFINKTDYEVNILGNYPYLAWSKAYQKILSKYKEIIGDINGKK